AKVTSIPTLARRVRRRLRAVYPVLSILNKPFPRHCRSLSRITQANPYITTGNTHGGCRKGNSMRTILNSQTILGCCGLLWALAANGIASAAAEIPADLAVSGTKLATVHATGVQIYTLKMKDAKPAWELKAPDATFSGDDQAGKSIDGKHYAG